MLQSREFKELRKPDGYPRLLNTLGDNLKARRLDLCLRQQDIAEMLGVSPETVLGWEKNEHIPTISVYPKLGAILGIAVADKTPAKCIFGQKLIEARKKRGLSQRLAAAKIGIDPCTLAKYERYHGAPDKRIISLLEDFLDQPDSNTNVESE